MPVQNFGEHTPKKNSKAKNMQNLARFQTIFADRREILHDGQYEAQFYNAGPKFWGNLF